MKISEIRQKLKQNMSEKRYLHSMGVAYTAASLAMRYSADVDQAMLAGWLHDCGKENDEEKLYQICLANQIEVTEDEKSNLQLLHGKVGALFAQTKYGVFDDEVLSAIRYHITGRPEMSILEKIVFVADFIEPSRTQKSKPSLEVMRRVAFENLDKSIVLITKDVIDYLKQSNASIDKESIKTYEYYEMQEVSNE